MTDWAAFAGFAGVVLLSLLLLARASERSLGDAVDGADPELQQPHDTDGFVYPLGGDGETGTLEGDVPEAGVSRLQELSTTSLLLNVALTQGLFAALLLAGLWYTGVPPRALGIVPATTGLDDVALGLVFGVGLYLVNEVGAAVGRRAGLGGSEALREALAPETARGWVALLFGVLPIIAGFEELLFRGVLVGAFAAGFGVSPWLLAVLSSVAFAIGHGAQGSAGVVVTGVLGFVLAAGYVLTGSLLLVVVAHYVVNALEFVVHELFGVEWAGEGSHRR